MASPLNLELTVMTPEQLAAPVIGVFEGEHFKVRIDFFFRGGHVLHTLAEGVRKAGVPTEIVDGYVDHAKQAWVGGLRLSLLIAGLIVLAAALVAFFLLPNKAADVEELERAGAIPTNN